jgi:hypothetical protein
MATDSKKLLEEITGLIDREVQEMRKSEIRLTSDDTLTLVRFGKHLMDLIEAEDRQAEIKKDALNKLSDSEIRALASKALKRKEIENK